MNKSFFKSGKQVFYTGLAALVLLGTGSVINNSVQGQDIVRADMVAGANDTSKAITRDVPMRVQFDGVFKTITIKHVTAIPDGPSVSVSQPQFAGYKSANVVDSMIYFFGPNQTYYNKPYSYNMSTQYYSSKYNPNQQGQSDPTVGSESGMIVNQLYPVTYRVGSSAAGKVYTMDSISNMKATSRSLAAGSNWRITQVLYSDNSHLWVNAGKNEWLKLPNSSYLNSSAWTERYFNTWSESTVTRNGGAKLYHIVNNKMQATGRVLPKGSNWSTKFGTEQVDRMYMDHPFTSNWLNIGGNQWVRYTDVNNHKGSSKPSTPSKPSNPSNGIPSRVKINYVPGYGIKVWSFDANNKATMTSKILKHGTAWKVTTVKMINGKAAWYNLGGNQWIPVQYAVAY